MSEKCLSSVMACSLPHLVLHSVKQTKRTYLDWNHQPVISLLSLGDVFFSSLLTLLEGNLRRNHPSPYFLMSLQLAKCLDALFQSFCSLGITLICACKAAWWSLILSVLCLRTIADLRHELHKITGIFRAIHCSQQMTYEDWYTRIMYFH